MTKKLLFFISPLFLFSCEEGLFNKEEENIPATIEILFPQDGVSYYKTSLSFPGYLVFKLDDPEQNGLYIRASANGTVEMSLDEHPKYYDEEPDTLFFNDGDFTYPDIDRNNRVVLNIEVEDGGDESRFSRREISFHLLPDEVSVSNPVFSTRMYQNTEYLNLEFDISTLSGDLGSVVSLNYTISPKDDPDRLMSNFEYTSWSLSVPLNCNGCDLGGSGPINIDLTPHYSSIIYGPEMDSGASLYLYVYVFDPVAGNSAISRVYRRFDLGIIP